MTVFSKAISAVVLALAALTVPAGIARADVTLPLLISDGMVLQQRTPVRIWGRADPNEKVTVSLQGQSASAMADATGSWEVTLRPLRAGGPLTMTVTGKNRREVKDVLVGEVWVASGQSNMEWSVAASANAQEEIAGANDPQLRMFTVPKRISAVPQTELEGGRWETANPQAVGRFSAVGYSFARALRQSLKVPVGILHSSWGGTRIEAWMSRPLLERMNVPAEQFALADTNSPAFRRAKEAYDQHLAAWKAAGSPEGPHTDPGISDAAKEWAAPDTATADWRNMTLPRNWEQANNTETAYLDGAIWFRRDVEIPAALAGKELTLSLGAIDDHDITYFNGVRVGATGPETPNSWQAPRRYTIPGNLVKAGRNVVTVRVWDGQGGGGFTGPATEMHLFGPNAPAAERISLTGPWRYKVELARLSDPGAMPTVNNPNAASGLYNGMLFPLTRYAVKGAIWYQGESNAGQPDRYRELLPAMIRNWQEDWKAQTFAFGIVQLAPFMAIKPEPAESSWAGLRASQAHTATTVPNAFLAVITDVGDVADIHPRQKRPVGERLALGALRAAYGQRIVSSGPTIRSVKAEGSRVVLTFDNAGAGLEARGTDSAGKPAPAGKVVGFAVAGADGKWVWADAAITGRDTVTLTSPVPLASPVTVSYGWADYPVVNLWNKDGLPAIPFRASPQR